MFTRSKDLLSEHNIGTEEETDDYHGRASLVKAQHKLIDDFAETG